MKNYGEERNFPNSEGKITMFEEHVWVDKLYRIHILVHETTPVIEIGYMGRHLQTVNFPT